MARRTKVPNGSVDLGLSQFLNKDGESVRVENTVSSKPYAAECRENFEELAQREEWGPLRELCESVLAKQPEGEAAWRARLWWVRSQLSLREIPLTVVAGPLESLGASLLAARSEKAAEPSISNLCRQVSQALHEVSIGLSNQGEQDLAIACLERAYRLDSSLAPALCELVEKRIRDSEILLKQKRHANLAARLQALLEELGKSPPPAVPQAAPQAGVAVRRVVHGNAWRAALLVVLLVLAGAVSVWLFNRNLIDAGSWTIPAIFAARGAAPFSIVSAEPTLSVEPPAPEPFERVSELNAVLYDLKNMPKLAITPKSVEPLVVNPSPTTAPKATIDISGPVESAELAAQRLRPQRRDESPQDVAQRDGFTPFEMPKPPGTRAEEEAFREFSPPRRYSVLVRTEVMPRPSIRGLPLGRLEPGTYVTVEAREGYWLRIRSSHGNRGYVLAQDAVPE